MKICIVPFGTKKTISTQSSKPRCKEGTYSCLTHAKNFTHTERILLEFKPEYSSFFRFQEHKRIGESQLKMHER